LISSPSITSPRFGKGQKALQCNFKGKFARFYCSSTKQAPSHPLLAIKTKRKSSFFFSVEVSI
jgi:hypothetical protein